MSHFLRPIQIVIVIYEIELKNSLSYKTLCDNISVLSCDYELLIYNNSPEFTIEEKDNYVVVNARQNEMLSGAYNYALQRAINHGCDWLLLLDQDTCLTKEYFEQLNVAMNLNVDVAAIIPKLQLKQKHLSPIFYCPLLGPWAKMTNICKDGIINNKTILAFNSVALFSVNALDKIGGFSSDFPLDSLDFYIFYRLSKNKEQFYLMNAALQHDLSVRDYKNKMTIQRYITIIDSEYKFSKLLGIFAILTFKFRLVLRFFKQFLIKEKQPYMLLTLRYLFKIN